MYKYLFVTSLLMMTYTYSVKSISAESEELFGISALSWLKEHDNESWLPSHTNFIKPNLYYQLGPLKLPYAVRDLKSNAIVKLTQEEAKYYNIHYKSEKNLKPYLVRAVFSNYTGSLVLIEDHGTLLIAHGSLGSFTTASFTPLIVNLKEKPTKLILRVSGAL